MIDRLRGEVSTLPSAELAAGERLVAVLEAERVGARAEMLDELDSDRYAALRRSLVEAVSAPLPEPPAEVARPELIELVRRDPQAREGGASRRAEPAGHDLARPADPHETLALHR